MLQKCIKDGMRKGEIISTIDYVNMYLILWASIMGFIATFTRKEKYIRGYFKKDIKEVIEDGFDFKFNKKQKLRSYQYNLSKEN